MTRLITSYAESGRVKAAQYQRRKFATRYTARDVELLAYVDKWHGNLSGPATKRICDATQIHSGQTQGNAGSSSLRPAGPVRRLRVV